MRRPIFSTYTGGENRVTSTLLAVLEHVGVDLTERLLSMALGESSIGLVSYLDQPSRGGEGVPDGEIRGRFRYLFETKTVIGQFRTQSHVDQLRRHLERLDGSHGDERLLVLTPDAEAPELVVSLDPRVSWLSFRGIADAIAVLLDDPDEPAGERQRYLLRQLVALFTQEGLLDTDDTLVVAARQAYPTYLATGGYICQANRTFRNVPYFGFYTERAIQPEVARQIEYYPDITLSSARAAALATDDGHPHGIQLSRMIVHHLENGLAQEGDARGAMVLTGHDDPATIRLDRPVQHVGPGGWTQGQRYVRLDLLRKADTTEDLANKG